MSPPDVVIRLMPVLCGRAYFPVLPESPQGRASVFCAMVRREFSRLERYHYIDPHAPEALAGSTLAGLELMARAMRLRIRWKGPKRPLAIAAEHLNGRIARLRARDAYGDPVYVLRRNRRAQ